MDEELLPPEILLKATRRGNEFAWLLQDVPNTIVAAQSLRLATLGGQVQFRTPDGICELYWLSADTEGRHSGEAWSDYVVRSAAEVMRRFCELEADTDFIAEGLGFTHLADLRSKGEMLEQYLCFVLYFEREAVSPDPLCVG